MRNLAGRIGVSMLLMIRDERASGKKNLGDCWVLTLTLALTLLD